MVMEPHGKRGEINAGYQNCLLLPQGLYQFRIKSLRPFTNSCKF